MNGKSMPQGAGVAFGLLIGLVLGLTLLDNIGLGIAIGLALGAGFESVVYRRVKATAMTPSPPPDNRR